jgi:hypothetical protein
MGALNNNEDRVRKLIEWKRHEQPPPGYFDALPDRILFRVQTLRSPEHASIWRDILSAFDIRPVLLGAFGTAAFGIFFFGVSLAEWVAHEPSEMPLDAYHWMIPADRVAQAGSGRILDLRPPGLAIANSSITPLLSDQPGDSWFNGQGLKVQPASFSLPVR